MFRLFEIPASGAGIQTKSGHISTKSHIPNADAAATPKTSAARLEWSEHRSYRYSTTAPESPASTMFIIPASRTQVT